MSQAVAWLRRLLTSGLFWATCWVPLAVAVLIWAGVRRHRADAARLARAADRRLAAIAAAGDAPTSEVARFVLDAMTRYLSRAVGRPEGALTPAEADQAIALVTRDAPLAERASRLVADCEHALYAPSTGGAGQADLIAEARGVFQALSRRSARHEGP